MKHPRWFEAGFSVLAIILALAFTSLVLVVAGAPPFKALENILNGAVGSSTRMADIVVAWVPLIIVTCGLLITFTAGLWNIGIEGQIMMGAIFTTGMLRLVQDGGLPVWLIFLLGFLAGMLGGALWALLAGVLKVYGNVNEIFGGLGLNFVATAISIWLIFGAWKRPGTGSMSGTEPFDSSLWLPTFAGLRLSPVSLIISLLVIVVVYFLLKGTYFGLRLKAVGKNSRAAFLLGIPTSRYMLLAFALCGVFAGLAGSLQVMGVYYKLLPAISSGYGFLGLLVAMLVNYQVLWAPLVALFFAALNIGSIQLPIILKLDSALSGVLQGSMVLFVLLMDGVRQKVMRRFTEDSHGQ